MEVLEFVVPTENNKIVFVWNLEANGAEDKLYRELSSLFSAYGPLYLLRLCPAAPGFYSAVIKFFSAVQALRAQQETDGRMLFQNRPLKVRLSSKTTPHVVSHRRLLSHTHCLTLANHCLGFNAWTSDIICEVRLRCEVQLSFPFHLLTTRGTAELQETVPQSDALQRARLLKAVREQALVQAFSKVVLVLLGSGKILVELKDSAQSALEDSVIQVNEVSLPPDEEEEL